MIFILSSILSLILSFLFIYFAFFLSQPEYIRINGFINFLMTKDALGGLIGGFIGMMALNLIVIFPFIITLPSTVHKFVTEKKFGSKPNKTTGKILNIVEKSDLTILDITYNEIRKSFEIPSILLTKEIKEAMSVVVFYDPSTPSNSYLDLLSNVNDNSSITSNRDTNSVFKLLEITPKFDITTKTYELIGEIHSEDFKGKKASFVYKLEQQDLDKIVPGKIYPCSISGNIDNYSIDIEID